MNVSSEVAAAQAAYAARPFAVRWCDSHFATTERFNTFDEAFAYLQRQVARITRDVKRAGSSWVGAYFWESYIETSEGRVQANYYLLADSVSSSR